MATQIQASSTKAIATADELPPLYKESFVDILFGTKYELLPQVSQRYEFDLAYGETQSLSDDELVERSAYLHRVNGRLTHHYHICQHRITQVDPYLELRQQITSRTPAPTVLVRN